MSNYVYESAYALARKSLASYAKLIWSGYETPEHVIKICNTLESVERRELMRICLSCPPRHSKTMNIGEFFPAWYFGRNPHHKVIYATCSQDLADNVGLKVRDQLLNPIFHKVFPGCHLNQSSRASHRFKTLQRGEYYAIGRGGTIVGKGADIMIVDDIYKDHKEAASKTIRDEIRDWFRTVIRTRLQKNAPIIFMGTRWNLDDLIGWVMKMFPKQNWQLFNFPARDKNNNPLWPEMYDDETLSEIEETLGSYFWNALYMGRPTEREGSLLKRHYWKFYQKLPPKFDVMIQSWDATFKKSKTSSYVVGQLWGKLGANCYLIDQVRRKMGFLDTCKSIIIMSGHYPLARTKLVEDKANGSAIIDTFKKKITGIKPVNPEGSKYARAEAVSYVAENGNCYLPDPAQQPWVQDFIDESASFDKGDYTDQVDAWSQAMKELYGEFDPIQRIKNFLMI